MSEDIPTTKKLPTTNLIHYLIVYPTLATSLIAAVPTVWKEYKAWRLGINSNELQLVQEQQRLWIRNVDCLQKQGVWEVDGPDGIIVKVTMCRTGDVLLRYQLNDWVAHIKWVSKPDVKERH